MSKCENPVFFWDFTVSAEKWKKDDVINHLKEISKKWVFQLEKGKGGYLHYQGRMSLKDKARSVFWEDGKCSPTSTLGSKTFDYVMKEDTRVEGPWSNKDKPKFLQKKVAEVLDKGLRPFQETIRLKSTYYEDRIINVIIDENGNIGKSTLVALAAYEGWGRKIPMMSGMSGKDIMQLVMCMPKSKCYFIDFPRSTNQKRVQEYFEALEMIKDGYAFDIRYEFEDEWFEIPCIWVIMNIQPDITMLSRDRWKFWTVDKKYRLEEYEEEK